jgi:hypothetical protein
MLLLRQICHWEFRCEICVFLSIICSSLIAQDPVAHYTLRHDSTMVNQTLIPTLQPDCPVSMCCYIIGLKVERKQSPCGLYIKSAAYIGVAKHLRETRQSQTTSYTSSFIGHFVVEYSFPICRFETLFAA